MTLHLPPRRPAGPHRTRGFEKRVSCENGGPLRWSNLPALLELAVQATRLEIFGVATLSSCREAMDPKLESHAR